MFLFDFVFTFFVKKTSKVSKDFERLQVLLNTFTKYKILHFDILIQQIHFWMYEVAPSILESRLLGSNNIVDAAVVGIPDKENGQVKLSDNCQTWL